MSNVAEATRQEFTQLRTDIGRLQRHVDLRMDRLEECYERTRSTVQACQRERSTLTGCAVGQSLADESRRSRLAAQSKMQRFNLVINALSVAAIILIAVLK